jgi:hypothetical protein
MPPLPSISASAAQYKLIKTQFSSNATPQKMIGPNPNRVALTLWDAAGNIFYGTPDSKPSTSGGLLNQGSSAVGLMLTFDTVGPLVQEEFWSCRLSGGSTTGIVEVIYVPTG